MTIEELKTSIAQSSTGSEEKSGKSVMFSGSGPVGFKLINDIVAVLEVQERRIAELEKGVRFS